MKRREMKILGLSYSTAQDGSYILVLSEVEGMMKLPIIIKTSDAQKIALEIESVKGKPQIHNLFKDMTDAFGIDIQEVYIHSVLEGIFYTKIISNNGIDDVEIECNVGDAVILSLIYGCPIFTSQDVLTSAGVLINDDGSPMTKEDTAIVETNKRVVSIEDLEKMLEHAINEEEFEIAAQVRDRIQELKNKAT